MIYPYCGAAVPQTNIREASCLIVVGGDPINQSTVPASSTTNIILWHPLIVIDILLRTFHRHQIHLSIIKTLLSPQK
jgi:hypothetical protein